jgi:histidine triad (HIT) family protein
MSENCTFCQIIRRQAPSNIVYEDEQVVAFLSNRPVNVGHTLVVPKNHYVNIFEISEDEACYLFRVLKRVAGAVRDAVSAEGLRIVQNNGKAAGQVIFHLHVHIIPLKPQNQYGHDGAFRDLTHQRSDDELKKDAEQIRHILNREKNCRSISPQQTFFTL